MLFIGAADEDAEFYRGIADRLASGCRVVTYDRRGTRRSGREGWPSGSARHADDAADLISSLGMEDVTVLGASAGGLVALGLGLRHPDLVKTVLCSNPGCFKRPTRGERFSSVARRLSRNISMHTLVTGRVPWTLWDGQRLVRFRTCRACSLLPTEKSGLSVEPMRTLRALIRGDLLLQHGKRSTWRRSDARQTCVSPTALHLCQSFEESQPILRPAVKSYRTLSKAWVIASSTTQTQQRVTFVAGCKDRHPQVTFRDTRMT